MSTEKRRESPAGFHYYSTYVDCPRKAYLKYILGLKHKYTGKALLFGGAIHEALASYYQKATRGDLPLAIERFEEDLDSRKNEYEKPDDFVADLQRGPLMLAEYHKTWNLEDPKRYEILEVETPYEIWIGPEKEFRVTVRPDRVVRDLDTGLIYPQETKTTSWSVGGIFGNTVDSDQVTAYIWALSKTRPEWHVDRCLIDVLYKRGQVIICDRPGFGVRTQEELILFEMEMYGTILEFTQKYKTLSSVPWPLLFRANKSSCMKWGCEYSPICRTNLKPETIPPMFELDDWHNQMTEDLQLQKDFQLKDWRKTQ